MAVVKCSLAFVLAALSSVDAQDTLRQVSVISRHGVRGPYGPDGLPPTEANLGRYSKNHYPFAVTGKDWGTSDSASELVSPKLTAHGRKVIQRMGEYFSGHLYPSLAQKSDCEKVFAYADDNERDLTTAQAFLDGFLPSTCADVKPNTNGSRLLFEQGQDPTASCPATSQSIYSGIVGNITADNIVRFYASEIQEINDIIDCCQPAVCVAESSRKLLESSGNSSCDLFHVPSKWSGKFYEPWVDSFSEAQYLSEWFLMSSLNNMTLPPSKTLDDMVRLGSVHNAHMQLITNQFNAENFGSTLLVHLLASMEEGITKTKVPLPAGDGPQLLHDPTSQFLYYAGHDINLLYLKNMLRLEWETTNWMSNQPNPGSMLVFELHADAGKSESTSIEDFYLQAYFMAATPKQIRNADVLTPLNAPDRVAVSIPHCSKDVPFANGSVQLQCRFTSFKSVVGKSIEQVCVSPSLQNYASTLINEPSMHFVWSMQTIAIVILAITLGIVTFRYIALRRKHASAEYGKYAAIV